MTVNLKIVKKNGKTKLVLSAEGFEVPFAIVIKDDIQQQLIADALQEKWIDGLTEMKIGEVIAENVL